MTGLLADNAPQNNGPDFGKASPVGLLILVVLMIATFLLIRSMNRHLKKVPKTFDDQPPTPDQPPPDQKPPDQTNPDGPTAHTDAKQPGKSDEPGS